MRKYEDEIRPIKFMRPLLECSDSRDSGLSLRQRARRSGTSITQLRYSSQPKNLLPILQPTEISSIVSLRQRMSALEVLRLMGKSSTPEIFQNSMVSSISTATQLWTEHCTFVLWQFSSLLMFKIKGLRSLHQYSVWRLSSSKVNRTGLASEMLFVYSVCRSRLSSSHLITSPSQDHIVRKASMGEARAELSSSIKASSLLSPTSGWMS